MFSNIQFEIFISFLLKFNHVKSLFGMCIFASNANKKYKNV